MYHCNLAKTPALPLLSRVSRRPKCSVPSPSFDSRSISFGSHQEALNNDDGFNSSARPRGEAVKSVHQKPLRSGVRRIPRCFSEVAHQRTSGNSCGFKAVSFSFGFHQRTRAFRSEFCLKTLMKPRDFSNASHLKSLESMEGRGTRIFSRSSHQKTLENDTAGAGKKVLPWVSAYGGGEGKEAEKKTVVKTNRLSWTESAESYFSRSGRKLSTENTESRVRSAEKLENREEEKVEEDNADVEPIEDPRWDRIKSKYKGFVDRESRFEKPEVHRWNKQENWGRKTWKEATESSVPKMVGQGVYGVGPVLAALTVGRREFYALYVQEGLDLSGNSRKKKDKKGVEKVLRIAEKIGLKVIEASKHDLNMVVDNRPHQGLVLDASPLEMVKIKELEPVSVEGNRSPLWVALDEVTDPQNLGAIIRSAYFFGAEGVVMCAKNSAPLSGVVSKASAGSLELIELRSCKNMMQFLLSSIENGWRVLGGSVSSKALPLTEVEAGVPTVLVLGSEGSGLRPLVERSCTQLIRIPGNIPMNGDIGETKVEVDEMEQSCSGQELKSFHAVESLNVSVAAGVLLYHLVGNNGQLVGEKPSTALL